MAGTRFGGRTLARSQALQLLFQAEATGRLVSDVLEGQYALDDGPLDEYGERVALGADALRDDLDAVLGYASANWSVSRMPAVDRNLLRIALYEILEEDEIDTAVAIDECVELAKAYGTDESSRFVNGLLGKIVRSMDEGVDVVAVARESLAEAEEAEEPAGGADAEVAADDARDDGDAEPDSDAAAEPAESAATPTDDAEDLPEWARG